MSEDMEEALLERLFGDRPAGRSIIIDALGMALSSVFAPPMARQPMRGAHLPRPGKPKPKRPYKGSKAAKRASRKRRP